MITVQNKKITVKLTKETYRTYLNKAHRLSYTYCLPSGAIKEHTPKEFARGLILSDAMQKLRYINDLSNFYSSEDSKCIEILKHIKNVFSEKGVKHNRYVQIDTNGLPIVKYVVEETEVRVGALEKALDLRYEYLMGRIKGCQLYVTLNTANNN